MPYANSGDREGNQTPPRCLRSGFRRAGGLGCQAQSWPRWGRAWQVSLSPLHPLLVLPSLAAPCSRQDSTVYGSVQRHGGCSVWVLVSELWDSPSPWFCPETQEMLSLGGFSLVSELWDSTVYGSVRRHGGCSVQVFFLCELIMGQHSLWFCPET